jgi:hypothetical protein
MAKAKAPAVASLFRAKGKRKLGRHKKKATSNKGGKNYKKKYRGQGR